MGRNFTKKRFMEKLRFYLSLHFDDEECANILNDYEEWFENETIQGKSEEVICAALISPKKVAHNIILEEKQITLHRMYPLFRNGMMQILSYMTIFILISMILLKICNKNSLNYFYVALGIMFLSFMFGMIIVKKDLSTEKVIGRSKFYVCNLFSLCFSIGIILSERFVLPKMKFSNSGIICFFVISVLILGLFLINVYWVVKKSFLNKQLVFLTTLHISGILSLLFYAINQSHFIYNDMMEYSTLINSSISIYLETVLLCLIFFIQKVRIRGNI